MITKDLWVKVFGNIRKISGGFPHHVSILHSCLNHSQRSYTGIHRQERRKFLTVSTMGGNLDVDFVKTSIR